MGRVVKCRFIEFFVFDSDFLPYLLSLFYGRGITFPLAVLDINCSTALEDSDFFPIHPFVTFLRVT